jgi:hypothetical protein
MKPITYKTTAAVFLGSLAIPASSVYATTPVHCYFTWYEDATSNVVSAWGYTSRSVRSSEYNRLIDMGNVPARASAELGDSCTLNHPENTLIDIKIVKDYVRLDPSGRLPSCSDLGARVECLGRQRHQYWGAAGDLAVAGDFNRDGQGDRAVFRPSNRTWYFDFDLDVSTDHQVGPWGRSGDLPIAGDFDRDGYRDDIAVFRASNRTWYFDFNRDGTTDESRGPWAVEGDLPLAGDFDRDGHYDDVAVFRPSNRTWYFDYDHNGTTDETRRAWAEAGDLPFSGDFDGDGRYDDVGVYRVSNVTKYVDLDHNASTDGTGFDRPGDRGCHPVTISRSAGDEVFLFCGPAWWSKHPGSRY